MTPDPPVAGEGQDPTPAPSSAAAPPAAPAETTDAAAWHRLHPFSPLLRGGLFLIVLIGIILANLRDRLINLFVSKEFVDLEGKDVVDLIVDQGLVIVALIVVLVVIALIVLLAWLSYRFHTYRITSEAVEARSGVVFRQHRRAPLERIQSVNLQRPLLARALGLAQLEVQTAGQGGKVALAYLGFRDAQAVRAQILRRAAATQGETAGAGAAEPADGAAAGDAPSPDPTMISYGGGTAHLSAAKNELDRRVHDFVDADIDAEAQGAESLVGVPPGRLIGSLLLSWELVVFVALAVASVLLGVLGKPGFLTALIPLAIATVGVGARGFNRGWAFTLSRSSDAVRVGAGLTATRTETLPLGRIHAVEARQPLFWRPFGWWQMRVTTAGHTAANGGQGAVANVVLPVGLETDVLRVFESLLPGTARDPEGEAGLRDALLGAGEGFLGAGPRAGWVLWFARRRTGLRLVVDEDPSPGGDATALRIRRGALTRGLSIVPILRVQSVQLHRPPVHRLLGLAAVQTHTVLGPVHTETSGLALEQAQAVFDLLAREVVRVQGAEAAVLPHGAGGAAPAAPAGTATPAATAAPAEDPAPRPGRVVPEAAAEPRQAGGPAE